MENNQDLEDLDCHFAWDLEDRSKQKGTKSLIQYLLKDMRMNADVKTKAMVTLSYVYMLANQSSEAEEMVNSAIAECDDRLHCKKGLDNEGYRAVGLANKVHILHCVKKPANVVQEAYKAALEAYASVQERPQGRAGINGLKGYTFSLFDDFYMKGIECFQQAMYQDPQNFEWPLGICILSRRLRSSFEGHRSLPTKMEEDTANLAIKLSKREKALPLALLADVLLAQGRGVTKGQDIPAKKAAAAALYREACDLEPNSVYVLKRCGKAFSLLQDADFAERCLKKALELDPGNGIVLHGLGQLYEFSQQKNNLELAEKYYKLAIDGPDTHKRNVYADIDLARIRSKRFGGGYNILEHYKHIRQYYLDCSRDLTFVDGAIQRQEEYLESLKTNRHNKQFNPRIGTSKPRNIGRY